jgi:YfiH family protein
VVVNAATYTDGEADASYCTQKGKACVVLSADCLPILICNQQGNWVMAIHAGWKGLANRVVEAAIAAYPGDKNDLMAYLGPAIGPEKFEVQTEVVEACTADLTSAQKKIFTKKCFKPIDDREGVFLCDIYELGRQRLRKCGVQQISSVPACTYTDAQRFYSYRRDSEGGEKPTGRIASLIWLV